jgi:SNF2 family DNA or RNA helicase
MIYYSKGYNLEHDQQSEARCWRGGSEIHSKITRIDLVCKGTIDEVINEALLKKQNLADMILRIGNRI